MIFIETPIFTREIQKYLSDDELRKMQSALLLRRETWSPAVVDSRNYGGAVEEKESEEV